MRQNYPQATIRNHLKQWDKILISEARLFTSGFDNSSYDIPASDGRYVLKIYEIDNISFDHVELEAQLMGYLAQQSMPVPQIYLTSSGKQVGDCDGKPGILMAFAEGVQLSTQDALSEAIAADIGTMLGKIDACSDGFESSIEPRVCDFDFKIFANLFAKRAAIEPAFRSLIDVVNTRFDNIFPEFMALPRGFIHNDAVLHNFLSKDGRITALIDFTDMVRSPHCQNLAIALAQNCFGTHYSPDHAKALVKAYIACKPIPPAQLEWLPTMIAVRFAQIILGFSQLNVDLGFDEERSRFIADNASYLDRFLQNEIRF